MPKKIKRVSLYLPATEYNGLQRVRKRTLRNLNAEIRAAIQAHLEAAAAPVKSDNREAARAS